MNHGRTCQYKDGEQPIKLFLAIAVNEGCVLQTYHFYVQLHFIFRHKNPKTGEFEEKHAKKTTADLKGPYNDKGFHLYTLVVNPDNTFAIYIDQKEVNSGSLLEDMT